MHKGKCPSGDKLLTVLLEKNYKHLEWINLLGFTKRKSNE